MWVFLTFVSKLLVLNHMRNYYHMRNDVEQPNLHVCREMAAAERKNRRPGINVISVAVLTIWKGVVLPTIELSLYIEVTSVLPTIELSLYIEITSV